MASVLKAFLVLVAITVSTAAFADDARMALRTLGKPDAPIKVDEFVSLTCTHCAEFYTAVLPEIKKTYIDTGKVKFVLHDFPLDGSSLKAAAVARCMPADEYFPFIETLFKTQATWALAPNTDPEANMIQLAALGGLGKDKAKACAEDTNLQNAIVAERTDAGTKYQVEATPTFVINDGAIVLKGSQSPAAFAGAFDPLLAAKK